MEKNKVNIKKGILVGCIIGTALLLGFLGSYAYFISTGNNNQNQSADVQTGNMALTFSDGNNGINESLNFGESITKTFTIENTGTLEAKAKIKWTNLINTYLKESLTYTLSYSENENGVYTELVSNKNVPINKTAITRTLANSLTIPVGTTYYYKLTITLNYLEDIDQTQDLNASFSTEFSISEDKEDYSIGIVPKMIDAIVNNKEFPDSSVQEGNPTFAESATTDETMDGLYTMEDDYGTSYYFRGAVENNYVKFGDFYWRIIRINGDGSLRMIYDGTRAHTNGVSNSNRFALTRVAWNSDNGDAKYAGYMFSPSGTTASTSKEQAQTNKTNTNVKTQLENWYKTNIKDKGLDENVADSIYCNDRSTPGKEETGYSGDTGLGYGTNKTAYGAYARLGVEQINYDKVQPRFTCPNKNDAFTKSDISKGNGKLTQKVGLITADEAVAAGSGKFGTANSNYYLYKGSWYWTLSPSKSSIVFYINTSGHLGQTFADVNTTNVAPVISLTPEYASNLKGFGTIESPYEIEEQL